MSGNRVLCRLPCEVRGRQGRLAERWHLHSVGGGNTASKGMRGGIF